MDEPRIIPNKKRKAQVAPTRRKLFDAKARKIFLEHLAATCNVVRSAEAAGIHYRTAYRTRMEDPVFRADWGRALEQDYARLEMIVLERAMRGAEPIALSGDGEAPEDETVGDEIWDRDLALHLLREHKRGLAGIGKAGAPQTRASMAEVRNHFVRKLKALGVRLDAKDGEGGSE